MFNEDIYASSLAEREDAYNMLGTKIIEICVKDYYGYLKEIYAYEHPDETDLTKRKWKSMRKEVMRYIRRKYKTNSEREFEEAVDKAMRGNYEISKAKAEHCRRFFYSNQFALYSQGSDGEAFIKATEKALERWVGGCENPFIRTGWYGNDKS